MGAGLWMKHGALDYKECMGDDLNPKMPPGFIHQVFPRLAGSKAGETVWFSFIVFRSKKHRDSVNAKVMKEMKEKMKNKKGMSMPFDLKRMAYGGFEVVVTG